MAAMRPRSASLSAALRCFAESVRDQATKKQLPELADRSVLSKLLMKHASIASQYGAESVEAMSAFEDFSTRHAAFGACASALMLFAADACLAATSERPRRLISEVASQEGYHRAFTKYTKALGVVARAGSRAWFFFKNQASERNVANVVKLANGVVRVHGNTITFSGAQWGPQSVSLTLKHDGNLLATELNPTGELLARAGHELRFRPLRLGWIQRRSLSLAGEVLPSSVPDVIVAPSRRLSSSFSPPLASVVAHSASYLYGVLSVTESPTQIGVAVRTTPRGEYPPQLAWVPFRQITRAIASLPTLISVA